MRFAELDAVTVDGYGTLLTLKDPLPALRAALGRHGVSRADAEIVAAFAAEAGYYRAQSHLGADERSLAVLRTDCAGVFLEALGLDLDPASFVDDFVAALEFEQVPGAAGALAALRDRGLRLAVVANWDCALPEHLARLGLDELFTAIVTSAAAGAAKPDPAPFLLALERLGTDARRTLHVGDEPADEAGAQAAGMRFAPAPLASAFEGWE
jgi:FMN phosphatase YigB (HAD superfamily)